MGASKPMKVVIVGGSNTGLMCGVMFKHMGHEVQIFELNGDDQRADLAAGITTHPEFEKFMKLHDRVNEPWSIPSPGVQFLNKASGVKRRIDRSLQLTSWSVIYHRLRANFDGLASPICPHPPKDDDKSGVAVFSRGMEVTSLSLIDSPIDSQSDPLVEVTYKDLNMQQEKTMHADLVILASGANSKLRTTLFTGSERSYVGYVAFRGTVPESEVSEEAKKTFYPRLTYYTYQNGYILLYIIPGADGSLEPGHRRYNWVWYHPLAADLPEFKETMTDSSGTLHRNTLPVGGMQSSVWAKYVALANEVMCAPFAEMINKTKQPFITAINDVSCSKATALNGKVLIAGEALNLIRPHMALSTEQSATHALLLERVYKDEITLKEWEKGVLRYGKVSAYKTNAFGTWLLYGFFEAAKWAIKLAGVLVGIL